MIAKKITEHYQIEEELGSGGMGTVYRGLDTRTNEFVAIKHLKPEMARADLIERFQREGEALRELNHPNIVKMLNAAQEDGQHYLILEYVSGGNLKDLLQQRSLTVEQVLRIAIQVADALTRAHFLNIIHRDLKPANILIAEDGTARLTDFGIARVISKERITATDTIIGTIDYLAPEAFSEDDINQRVDIWAFGVLLFEMLTGDVPFQADNIVKKIMAITTSPTPDLEALRPDAPLDLLDLIYRMLEKDPQARIASVRHVGASLEDIIQGRSLHTPPETRFATPIPEVLERPKHNLPAQTTAFVGREAELSGLAKLLDDPNLRLITIVASGGMGKTRLALEAAEQQIDNFANGVYSVELAPLSDPNNIVSAIADATGYQFQPDGREQKQQILDFLANKTVLLVMDNYEHLLAKASLVTDILNAAPDVQILATSRQRLNQSGETVFNLVGMEFPEWGTPEDALEYAAVKLFMQSAKRVQPPFELTADNMDYVARICILVQGMPLGILLAASWLAALSVEEIAEEIAQGLDFLESNMSDLPERHRSIRAVFDYSWDLMSETERDVFMKLSVFRGGFTREAAQAVAGANLRTLMDLMNKSLIRRDVDSGRYEVHELLRQYGEDQLMSSGRAATVYEAHAAYYADFMDTRWQHIKGPRQHIVLREIEMDIENVRAAWQHWTSEANVQRMKQFLHTLWTVYDIHGWYQSGIELFKAGCNAIQDISTDEAQAVLGWMLVARGLCEAIFSDLHVTQGTGLAADIWLHTLSETFPSSHLSEQGQTGFQLVQQGIQLLRQLESHNNMIIVPLISTFIVASWVEEDEIAKECAKSCLEIATAINDQWGVARAKQLLTVFAIREHQYEDAQQLASSALEIFEKHGDNWSKSVLCIEVLAVLALNRRQFETADNCIKQGLEAAQKVGFQYSIRTAYWQLGYAAALQEKYLTAGKYWDVAVKMGEQGFSGSSVFGSGNRSNEGEPPEHLH